MRTRVLLTDGSIGALSGLAAGAVTALAARVAMRMVADGVPDGIMQRPDFTLAGTAVIVVIGMLVGAPAGVLYGALAGRLAGPAGLRGASFGVLCLATVGPVFLTTDEFFTVGRVILFAPLFVLFGIVLGLARPPGRSLAARLPVPAQVGLTVLSGVMGAVAAIVIVSAALGGVRSLM